MKLLCRLGRHDFKLANSFESLITRLPFTGYIMGQWCDFSETTGYETQVDGYECRRCGFRKLREIHAKKDIVPSTWHEAINWQNEEMIL